MADCIFHGSEDIACVEYTPSEPKRVECIYCTNEASPFASDGYDVCEDCRAEAERLMPECA